MRFKFVGVVVFSLCLLSLGCGHKKSPSPELTAAMIGLGVGQKAPAFSGVDQFGHEQSTETLKGPKGTVLLFFRSADW